MTFSKLGTDIDTGQFVYLPKAARVQGLYIVGLQGMGKSGLLENLILEDINQQIGVCVLDPHGELIDHVLARLEPKQEKDVILLDIADEDYPFGLNLFECPNLNSPKQVEKTVDRVVHIFDKLLGVDEHTPLISQYLLHCTHTLVANPGFTMADIELLLTDKDCRQKLVANVKKSQTRHFWHEYYDPMPLADQRRERIFILRRVEKFLRDMTLPIVGQSTTTIDLQQIMDGRKILLVKLDRQMEQATTLIGSIIVALILNASASRQTQRQFHLYADEFQRFATEDFATLLEEARKAAIGITMAHQNRAQLELSDKQADANLKARTLNVGSLVVFRVPTDAKELAGQFDTTSPPAREEELREEQLEIREEERLEKYEMIDGDEEILVPTQTALKHLLDNGHKNHQINTFINQWLRRVLNQKFIYTEDPETQLNQLFYETMVTQRGDLPIPYTLVWRLATSLGYAQFLTEAPKQDIEHLLAAADTQTAVRTHHQSLLNAAMDAIYQREKQNLYLELTTYRDKLLSSYFMQVPTGALLSLYNTAYSAIVVSEISIDGILNKFPWMHIEILPDDMFQQLRATKHFGVRYDDLDKLTVWYFNSPTRKLWYTQQDIYNLISANSIFQTIVQAHSAFETFVIQLRNVLMLLAQEENWITVGSGQRQPRTRQHLLLHPEKTFPHPRVAITHPQPSSPEMEARIANQLRHLQKFTAWVKIAENIPQNPGKKCLNCGILNPYGALYCGDCGTQLPAANEYSIETLEPGKGLYGKPLYERIERIRAMNIQQGYLRERTQVEAEITQRQAGCSGGATPAQPQLAQPQQPRHARQVPVQGKCPNCGKSNPGGSQFCNQCGTKLT